MFVCPISGWKSLVLGIIHWPPPTFPANFCLFILKSKVGKCSAMSASGLVKFSPDGEWKRLEFWEAHYSINFAVLTGSLGYSPFSPIHLPSLSRCLKSSIALPRVTLLSRRFIYSLFPIASDPLSLSLSLSVTFLSCCLIYPLSPITSNPLSSYSPLPSP